MPKNGAKVLPIFLLHKHFAFFSQKKLLYPAFFIYFCSPISTTLLLLNRQHAMNLLPLYHWYERNCRILPWRETTDPYRIWVSEIILQQTRVAQGLDYYMRFVARFPDIAALATAPEDEVLLYWQGLGYYSRARNLHKAARLLYQQGKSMPRTFEELRLLPGVGDYTAGAIASFAYNLPYPALDGNVYRVLARLFDSDTVFDTSQGKRFFHTLALSVLDQQNPRLCNSALMELGALQCLPGQPDCDICPLKPQCQAFEAGTVALLPPQLAARQIPYLYYIYSRQPNTHLPTPRQRHLAAPVGVPPKRNRFPLCRRNLFPI